MKRDDNRNKQKKGHPHAALIMRYAEIAQTEEFPESWVGVKDNYKNEWIRLKEGDCIHWFNNLE